MENLNPKSCIFYANKLSDFNLKTKLNIIENGNL